MKDCRNYIYLNNAATSWPKPDCVAEAVRQALLSMPEEGNRGGMGAFDVMEAVRKELALWLGVSEPEQIALGCNATWGLNQGILGFPLAKGDWILTTCAEHNAVLRPLYRLQRQGGWLSLCIPDPQVRWMYTSGRQPFKSFIRNCVFSPMLPM